MIIGEFASDMSDAASTMWLNVKTCSWSDALQHVCRLTKDHMPPLFEENQVTEIIKPELLQPW